MPLTQEDPGPVVRNKPRTGSKYDPVPLQILAEGHEGTWYRVGEFEGNHVAGYLAARYRGRLQIKSRTTRHPDGHVTSKVWARIPVPDEGQVDEAVERELVTV